LLRREVQSLLEQQPDAERLLETPAWEAVADAAAGQASMPPPRFERGRRLGPFEIDRLVGVGGMGEVYRARDARLDRTVAIKVLPPAFASDPVRQARFEREAKTVAALNHPHICTLHDVGEDGGRTFLVMEHLDGRTLAERLKKGPLRLEQALTVATEIADALAAAHRSGVIHRDLKPSNVMLTKSGATLLDFGLAKWAGHGEPQATPTNTAPLTGQGVIIYEMVTGQRPFAGKSTTSLVAAILEHEPESIVAASSSSRTGGAS
jgi:serine/threonine protein kinase